MSLEVWMATGKPVTIGGREFMLMPLPLKRLHKVGKWLEENCNDVVQEVLASAKNKQEAANPFGMVTKVLLRVDANEIVFNLLSEVKDPETGKPLNSITKDFVDDYLDPISAKQFFETFIKINELESLIKNLQRLPIIKVLMDASLETFGIPFLSGLQLSTDSVPRKSEGSPSPKSTDTSAPSTSVQPEDGKPTNLLDQQPETVAPVLTKRMLQ